MSPVLRRPVAAFLLAGLALAGCGGGQHGPGLADHSYPEAAKSAPQILADAQQAARGVTTFHLAGAIKQATQTFGVDLHFDGTSGAYGWITYGGVSFNVVRIGPAVYFNAPAAFYANAGSPAQTAQMIAGRWIKARANSSNFRRFSNFTSGAEFFRGILGSAAAAGVVKMAGVRMIGATPAVVLRDPKDGSKLYIALQGPALPVRIDGPGQSGSMSVAGYGEPVRLVAPQGAVEFSKVKA